MGQNILSKIKVGVLGGGISPEREVSLVSADNALKALQRKGVNAEFIYITNANVKDIKTLITSHEIGLAFNALHGEFGEDGQIQKILEEIGVPYTGSGVQASFIAMDKVRAKSRFMEEGVPTPAFCLWTDDEEHPGQHQYPVVVKPASAGSSIGISIVRQASDLPVALQKAAQIQSKIIIERFVAGRELTVGILEDRPLAVVEIVPKQEYYDYYAKYTDNATEFVAPAKLDKKVYLDVQNVAAAAHKALGCRHFSRVDVRLAEDNTPYVLEVNSIPGLTSHSLLPLSAKVCGIGFDELILKMAELAVSPLNEGAQQTGRI